MIASASRRGLRNICVHHWSPRQLIANCSSKSAQNCTPQFIKSRDCWKCGSVLHHDSSLFCESTECGVIQELDQDGCNFFRLFGFEERFDLDDSLLETRFKNLQRLLHPDKFATKSNPEIERSNHNSSVVNQAYQLLKSPVDRVTYLLTCHGHDILKEGKSFSDPVLMKEMFELAETADELESEDQVAVAKMTCEVDHDIIVLSALIQGHVEEGDFVNVGKAAVKLKYLTNVRDTLKEKLVEI